MGAEALFPVIWASLRHPESLTGSPPRPTEVVLQERCWRHIVETHICDHTEPWSDVLGVGHVGALRRCPSGPFDKPPVSDSVRSVAGALGTQIEASLSHPLALTYMSLRSDQRPAIPTRKWHLVTPCGTFAIVTAGAAENLLRTAYFSGSVSAEPSRSRWREAVRSTVQECAKFDPATRKYTLPEPAHSRTTGCPPELRHQFRFVLPGTWGFSSDTTGGLVGCAERELSESSRVSSVPSSPALGDAREPSREGGHA